MRPTLTREHRKILDLIERATGAELDCSTRTKIIIADLFRTTDHSLRANLDALNARCELCVMFRDTLDRAEIDALGSLIKKPDLGGIGLSQTF